MDNSKNVCLVSDIVQLIVCQPSVDIIEQTSIQLNNYIKENKGRDEVKNSVGVNILVLTELLFDLNCAKAFQREVMKRQFKINKKKEAVPKAQPSKVIHQSKSQIREPHPTENKKQKQLAMLDLNLANKASKITYQINETPKLSQRTVRYFGGEN